jgi:hypothetical protein
VALAGSVNDEAQRGRQVAAANQFGSTRAQTSTAAGVILPAIRTSPRVVRLPAQYSRRSRIRFRESRPPGWTRGRRRVPPPLRGGRACRPESLQASPSGSGEQRPRSSRPFRRAGRRGDLQPSSRCSPPPGSWRVAGRQREGCTATSKKRSSFDAPRNQVMAGSAKTSERRVASLFPEPESRQMSTSPSPGR